MSKQFKGVWAVFEYLDDTSASIRELREAGFEKITTHSPCPRSEIRAALGDPQSRVPFFTLIGAICGLAFAVFLMTYTALDWILPVSAKPIVSIPVMGPVAFELSILTAALFTFIGMGLLVWLDRRSHPVPKSKKYESYNRFMRDRFGVVVCCETKNLTKVELILKKYQAEEVFLEN